MSRIANDLTVLIGHTPLLELTHFEKEYKLKAKVIAKLEYFNPLGSAKDRVGLRLIEDGIEEGKIIQFNRYHVSGKRKLLEEKANEIKEQWIKETENQIKMYKSLKVQLK